MNKRDSIRIDPHHDHRNYSVASLEDEIRADRHCAELLKHFHQYLLQELHTDPLEAGALAAGADYFLREFIIGDRRENIFEISPRRVRQFGGNWYIVRNLEPNLAELTDMLQGAAAFYRYCAAQDLIDVAVAQQIDVEAGRLEDFARRIEEFHQISGNGFKDWDRQCPIS
ncbi:MAG: hypothetical protein RQ754_08985 [Desulfuromonadales bacterium]|nr:hypothetical protein [Desulfuromonadales bacterium]